jgi:uncharacterized protein (TIGR03435 family)
MRCRMVFTLLVTAVSFAQQPVAFEAAAIHPVKLTINCFSMLPPGGTQYALNCVTLKFLIGIAYPSRHIEGGGPVLDDVYYDFRATVPGDQPWTPESITPMMKQFLSERFHLAVHVGKRDVSGYALVLAKSGDKLQATQPDREAQGLKAGAGAPNFVTPGQVQGRGVDADVIAGLLGSALQIPVANRTGLTGTYNFDLRYAPDTDHDSNLPSFFTAVEEQLGLKLQSQKIEVETVVVDHVDQEPAPN